MKWDRIFAVLQEVPEHPLKYSGRFVEAKESLVEPDFYLWSGVFCIIFTIIRFFFYRKVRQVIIPYFVFTIYLVLFSLIPVHRIYKTMKKTKFKLKNGKKAYGSYYTTVCHQYYAFTWPLRGYILKNLGELLKHLFQGKSSGKFVLINYVDHEKKKKKRTNKLF
jgi:hypothetical protein